MKALIIVDVQNDFIPGGSLSVPFGDEIIPVINSVQKNFELIVATQDWHPEDHISFSSNNPGKQPFDRVDINGTEQILWPDHCVQGTYGSEFHPDLDSKRFAAIFRKAMNRGVDSYSGFYDNNQQISTGLAGYLREKGATDIFFCGLASDICVYYTIKDAVRMGFNATFIEDASRPLFPGTFEVLKKELKTSGVKIVKSGEIL